MSGAIPTTVRLERVAEGEPHDGCTSAACGWASETARDGRSAFLYVGRPLCGRDAKGLMLLQAKAPR